MSILVGPVEAAELSLLPAGLVFDQAWMHLSSDFHFHSFKRKGDFTIDQKVETWGCLKIERGPKNRTEVILLKRGLAEIPEKYLWADFVYEAREFF